MLAYSTDGLALCAVIDASVCSIVSAASGLGQSLKINTQYIHPRITDPFLYCITTPGGHIYASDRGYHRIQVRTCVPHLKRLPYNREAECFFLLLGHKTTIQI